MDAERVQQEQGVPLDEVDGDGNEEVDAAAEKRMRKSLSPIDRQYEAQSSVPRRIHILGTGSIGKIVAHALRSVPNPPPVSLIFHRSQLLRAWESSKKEITVEDGGALSAQSGYDVELVQWERRQHGVEMDPAASDAYALADKSGLRPHEAAQVISEHRQEEQQGQQSSDDTNTQQHIPRRSFRGDHAVSDEPIHNLIVTTKATLTVPALAPIKHRLSRSSTICFLQNGMGIVDDVNAQLFPDEATRPNYVQGIITHGANVPPEKLKDDPFYVVHAGHGTIALGLLPRQSPDNTTPPTSSPPAPSGYGTDNPGQLRADEADEWGPSARYMLRTLTRCPGLCAVGFTALELLQQQLEKLAVNSILNPLTVLLDARNGSITYNFALTRAMRLLLAETSLVIRSLPELRGVANVGQRFDAARLETLVVGVAHKTRDNISSMLADVRAGRRTEIEYINGYIVKRGEEVGVQCVVNYAIMQTVVGKCVMVQRELADDVPVEKAKAAEVNTG